MVKILLFCALVISLTSYSQILDNTRGLAFTDMPFFNENFIRINRIKKLSGKYTVKKPGDIMRVTEYKYHFNFDSLGHIISTFETKNDNGSKDTTINIYEYNTSNLLKIHWKNDAHGYTTKHYEYDSLKQIIAVEVHHEIMNNKGDVEQTIVLNRETMKYEKLPNQEKKTVYNSYNLPYMEVFTTYNPDGYLLEVEERLKMTSSINKYVYSYDAKGYLAAIKTIGDVEGQYEEELTFKYDAFGNLQEKQIYRNGKHITDIQVIYNDQTKLLSSVLTRDVATSYIYILRFQGFEFFPKKD